MGGEDRPLVLVADDDESIRLLAGKALERGGFCAAQARDGEEALALFATLHPEVILLDVMMPKMDGYQVCSTLRRLRGGDSVPVMMMTSLDDIDSINRAYEAGATDFITKPINWVLLSHRVRYMIRASRTANELRRSEARNTAFLNVIPDLMLRMNGEGKFIEVKGAGKVDLGMPPQELSGKSLEEAMPADIVETIMHYVRETLESNRINQFDYSLRSESGLRYCEARIVSSGENEVLCIIRDVTEHKQMEEDLLKAQKLEATGILAGGIAHDFSNILSVIMGNINMAQSIISEGSLASSLLAEAEVAALRARDLTRRFITFSTGGTPFKKTVGTQMLIKEAVDLFPDGLRGGCECSFGDGLWNIDADPGQVRQALLNIVTNAGEAMPEGGTIRICVENLDVESGSVNIVSPSKAGRYVRISVQDKGVGIPPENYNRIFDPYFSTKERCSQKGMGLGLTVAYSIIKKHGGHIGVDSEPGVGTIFHIYLPASEKETV